jgi:hypothetical protein
LTLSLLQEIGLQMSLAIQPDNLIFDELFQAIIAIGAMGLFLLLPIIYWSVDKKIALGAIQALLLSSFICLVFNLLLPQSQHARAGDVQTSFGPLIYGAPTAYAASMLAVSGYLAYRLNKAWFWVASSFSVLLSGISLLYLGWQTPPVLLSSWLVGAGVMIFIIRLDPRRLPIWSKLSIAAQAAVLFGTSVLIILIGTGTTSIAASITQSLDWAGFETGSSILGYFYSIGGLFFGTFSGYLLMKKHIDYSMRCKTVNKINRVVLGLGGTLFIYFMVEWVNGIFLLPVMYPDTISHYLQAALAGFWVTCAAPWLFIRLNLARPIRIIKPATT